MKKRSYELLIANRKYKDTIFRWIFSQIENLLSLYNAVTGKHYQNPEELEIVTLENAIYMGMKNDLAFVLEMGLYLYEHQSTHQRAGLRAGCGLQLLPHQPHPAAGAVRPERHRLGRRPRRAGRSAGHGPLHRRGRSAGAGRPAAAGRPALHP